MEKKFFNHGELMFNKIFTATILILLTMSFAQASNCFSINDKNIELKWTAYKTPAKAGVSGTFKTIKLNGKLEGTSVEQLVENVSFDIDATTVFTKDAGRDAKLKTFIFNTIVGKKITGKFIKMQKGVLTALITMNGVSREVPLLYKLNNNALQADGHIDMLDFTMGEQIKAINKACLAKHEGKTWNDVALNVLAKFEECKK